MHQTKGRITIELAKHIKMVNVCIMTTTHLMKMVNLGIELDLINGYMVNTYQLTRNMMYRPIPVVVSVMLKKQLKSMRLTRKKAPSR